MKEMQYEHLEYTPYGELWVDHSVRSVGAYPTVFRFTAHERDPETGFTYAGARYLDPRTSRWISADPAMWEGDYFPRAPINDEARRHNENLRGEGGIFNLVNMHVFHYAGNNPIKYVDPDGRVINLKAAGVGALIGGVVSAGVAIATGEDLRGVGAAFVGGAVTGGMVGLTMGGSLAVKGVPLSVRATGIPLTTQFAGGVLATAAGGMTENIVNQQPHTVTDILENVKDGVASTMSGNIWGKLGDFGELIDHGVNSAIDILSNKLVSKDKPSLNTSNLTPEQLRQQSSTGNNPITGENVRQQQGMY